jgi:hypothetical protein
VLGTPSRSGRYRLAGGGALGQGAAPLQARRRGAGSSCPAIGAVCGAACAWNWIALPAVKVALAVAGYQLALSRTDITEMLPILMCILGMSGLGRWRRSMGSRVDTNR